LRRFAEYFLQSGYGFVGPCDIPDNLSPGGKYVLITFDDGYFNNHLALPLLKEYGIPAVFFVSTNHVRENRCFWWDVVYRERAKRGAKDNDIEAEIDMLRLKKHNEIETYVVDNFGAGAFDPIGDIDRPMTEQELRDFAGHNHVHIGNHTTDHAILTNYDSGEVEGLIAGAQEYLSRVTGRTPDVISYPNGNYSEEIIETCRRCGLRLGITVESRKNYLPVGNSDNLFRLGRFILHGNDQIERQVDFFRSDISIYHRLKKLLGKGITAQ
jgi:peptidoglycan/xylan/chitin deacetylase (PgdA/CDA1 family)